MFSHYQEGLITFTWLTTRTVLYTRSTPSMHIRNALLEKSVERNIPVLLLQMAEEQNVDMHSDQQNEEQLLMSENENRPQEVERAESPPRNREHRNRRIRRMDREQREIRERARDRRRQNNNEHEQRNSHSPIRQRNRSPNRHADRHRLDAAGRHDNGPRELQRSKWSNYLEITVHIINLFSVF